MRSSSSREEDETPSFRNYIRQQAGRDRPFGSNRQDPETTWSYRPDDDKPNAYSRFVERLRRRLS